MIRVGLSGDIEAFRKQVMRLQKRLVSAGDDRNAQVVSRLLEASSDLHELTPSRVETSRSLVRGEKLTKDTRLPVDRESGAPLCVVEFPDQSTPQPQMGDHERNTISELPQEWANVAALRKLGVEPTRTLLIYGPPGSGKTMTARHLAYLLKLPLVTAKIDGLVSSFLGTSARNISVLFDFANRYRCVLLLDEFDAVAKVRDDPNEVGEIKRVVNTLLQNLDLRMDAGITVAITNHEKLLDPAVWRRFETHLHLGDPGGAARATMINEFFLPMSLPPETRDLFAFVLEGCSGADIERTCKAVKRVMALGSGNGTDLNFLRALKLVLARQPVRHSQVADTFVENEDAFVAILASNSGMKQMDIAAAMGRTQSTISKLLNAKTKAEIVDG